MQLKLLRLFMTQKDIRIVFTARGYASAVLAIDMCLCLSAKSRSSTKMAHWIELIFGIKASFDLSYTAL